ncbi:MAG: hypothetical protein WCH46_02020 [bacterium]
MKHRNIALALFALLLSVTSLRAETVEEIITKHIAAIGGSDAWKKITSVKVSGTVMAQGTEVNVSRTVVNKKGMRQDVTLMGMNGYTIITPTAGVSFMPFGGQQKPEAMTADDVKQFEDELDTQNELVDCKQKGHSLELMGKEDVEGTECYKIKLTTKGGNVKTLFIDPSNYYLIREIKKIKANGQEMENTINYSNFQKLPEGIVFPMNFGMVFGELTIKKVEINTKIDESIFKIN